MKYIKYILIPILIPLLSCSDWLELVPPNGLVQDEYWKTKEDVEATLMGAYQVFNQMDEKLFLYGEVRGDMITRDKNTPNYINSIIEGNIYPDNELCDWSELYEAINYCNNVLKHNPIVSELDKTYSEFNMKGIESEALFLRSLAYFYLVRIFKEVPYITEPSESDAVDFYLPKSEEDFVLDAIKQDLLEARKFVREEYGSAENNMGRTSKNSINALLADISLWLFEYQECIDYINEIEKTTATLVSSGRWFSIFYPGNSLEGIFEVQFNTSLNQGNSLYGVSYTEDKYKVSIKAIERLSLDGAKEIVRSEGTYRETDSKIWKYCGSAPDGKSLRPSSDRGSGNWIIYRFADILLMKAEALSQLGSYDEAIDIVNQVRSRASMAPLSNPQSAEGFEDLILEERAKELAYEGKRWFDLLRMGRRNNYARKDKFISIIIQNFPSNKRLVLASKLTNPMGWYLPIEDKELERNNELEQNPYYEAY